jgi:hypothetical protein
MGGDGGVIASNRKYLRGAGTADHTGDSRHRHAPEQITPHAVSQELLTTCYLTKHPLLLHGGAAIVADPYGRLYLKEAAVEALLRRRTHEDALGTHVRGLKDLFRVQFQCTADHKPTCPVTGIELNGRHPALLVRSRRDGVNVISERALKELGTDALTVEYGDLDTVLRLAPPPTMMEDIVETVKLEQQQQLKTSSKKERKRKQPEKGILAVRKESKRAHETLLKVQAAVQSNEVLSSLFTDHTKQISDKDKKDSLFARMG